MMMMMTMTTTMMMVMMSLGLEQKSIFFRAKYIRNSLFSIAYYFVSVGFFHCPWYAIAICKEQ
jgi:hypothetical protein